jgi:DNA-binding protein H-NS
MARSLAQIEQQIEKLKQQAEAVKSKEKSGVVARIREAIAHYGITNEELFGARAPKAKRASAKKAAAADAAPKASKKKGVKRGPVAAKYADGQGNHWSGRGNKPRWLVAAIADGKKIEDFLIKA